MTKDELEAAIKAANLWAGRSTLVLAIGILGEYALLPFLEKKRWHLSAKIVFAALVVAGIVGEYEFSSWIAQDADELQRLSDAEVASLNNETARLRASVAGRELTRERQQAVASALTTYSGRTVTVYSFKSDPEGKRLGHEIISALGLANINIEDRLDSEGSLIFGIEVRCTSNGGHEDRNFANALIAALSGKSAGALEVRPLSEFGCDADLSTQILVGVKPPTLPN